MISMAITIIQQYVRISTGFLFLSTIQRTETSKLVFPDSFTSFLFLVSSAYQRHQQETGMWEKGRSLFPIFVEACRQLHSGDNGQVRLPAQLQVSDSSISSSTLLWLQELQQRFQDLSCTQLVALASLIVAGVGHLLECWLPASCFLAVKIPTSAA